MDFFYRFTYQDELLKSFRWHLSTSFYCYST